MQKSGWSKRYLFETVSGHLSILNAAKVLIFFVDVEGMSYLGDLEKLGQREVLCCNGRLGYCGES